MFIDVTRHGGGRVLRLAVAAIAYLDTCEGGTSLHLIGGQTLRVAETPAEIEERATPPMIELIAESVIDARLEAAAVETGEAAGLLSPAEATAGRIDAAVSRRGKR